LAHVIPKAKSYRAGNGCEGAAQSFRAKHQDSLKWMKGNKVPPKVKLEMGKKLIREPPPPKRHYKPRRTYVDEIRRRKKNQDDDEPPPLPRKGRVSKACIGIHTMKKDDDEKTYNAIEYFARIAEDRSKRR
jgi:hypothetical protein